MTRTTVQRLSGGRRIDGTPEAISAIEKFSTWAGILERHFPVLAPVFLAEANGEVVGGCYGYFHRDGGPAATLYVPRFAIFAPDAAVEKSLLLALGDHARTLGIRRSVVVYERACLDEHFRWTKVSVELRLAVDADVMFSRLRSKSRNTIRRAGEVFEICGGGEHLDAFYEVYAARMREKSLATNGIDFFRDLLERTGECHLMVARRSGIVEAGMIWQRAGSVARYLFNAATPEGLRGNANHLLMWNAMREYSACGIEVLDLGESSPNGGVYTFKTVQFGGVSLVVYYADILCGAVAKRWAAPLPWQLRMANRVERFLPERLTRSLDHSRRGYARLL